MGVIQSSINSVLATAAGLKIFKNTNKAIKDTGKELSATNEKLENIQNKVEEFNFDDYFKPVSVSADEVAKHYEEIERMKNRQATVRQQRNNTKNIVQTSVFDKDFDKGGNK